MNALAQTHRFYAGAGSGSGESSATPIGQIGVRAQVNVVFDLVVASR
jgi:hypothetical protein